MKIYVNNSEELSKKIVRFYDTRYEKLKGSGHKVRKSELKGHANEIINLLSKSVLNFDLSQPTYDEWVSKGYKHFTYKNWYFAVEYVVRSNGQGQWITVDCHHNSKNHNDTLLGESILKRMKELISYKNRVC